MRFQFGIRQAIGVALLLSIIGAYFVLRHNGHPANSLTPYIAVVGPLALLIAQGGKRSRCCRRSVERG